MAVTRRVFLRRALIGTAAAAGTGGAGLALWPGRRLPSPGAPLRFFTEAEYSIFAIVADRIVPAVHGQPSAADVGVAAKADALLAKAAPHTQTDFKRLLGLFDNALASFVLDGRATPFTRLSPAEQDAALIAWRDSRLPLRRSGFEGLQRLAGALYYSDPRAYPGVGYPGPPLLMRADGSVVGGTPEQRAAALAAKKTAATVSPPKEGR